MAETFHGSKKLQSFSPQWSDVELLEKTLIGRRELVDRLEELARDGAGGPNKHQRLIVGVRGSGKTHVLKVLHSRLWRDPELKERLLIIYLLEDELGVASFLDFVVRLLRAILNWYPEYQQLAGDLQNLYDLPLAMQEERAVQLLLKAAEGKDVLVVMENLGVTFDKVTGFGRNGQQRLRDLIQQHPNFMFFASAQALIDGVREENAPFYGFFKVAHLQPLSLDEARALLQSIAAAYQKKDVLDFLGTAEGEARVRAVYDFTGGNHRLLVIFYDFLCADSVARLSDIFIEALNPLKAYYQEQMRSLSAQQQKILQYLSLERTPRTVKQIARGCLASSNTVSSQLKELLSRNFVCRIQQGRESYYEVTETLFRICYEAEVEQKGAPIRLFVDFLANLYTAQELKLRYRGFTILADTASVGEAGIHAAEAQFYSAALARFNSELLFETDRDGDRILCFFQDLEKSKAYRDVIEFAKRFGDGRELFILDAEARAHAALGERDQAVAAAKRALERNDEDSEAHLVLAEVYARAENQLEEALAHAARACDIAPAVSAGWYVRARIANAIGRPQDAETFCRQVLKIDPNHELALSALAGLLTNAGRYEEALELLQEVSRVRPDDPNALRSAAAVLEQLGRTEEAEHNYRNALQLRPADADLMLSIGLLMTDSGRFTEALEQFEAATQTDPNSIVAWQLAAQAMQEMGRIDEAKQMYLKAIELAPDNMSVRLGFGATLGLAGRHMEALEQFEAAIGVKETEPEAWNLRASALIFLGRYEEAAQCLREAVRRAPGNVAFRRKLGQLWLKLGKLSDALDQMEEAIRLQPEAAAGDWVLAAMVTRLLGRWDAAEQRVRKGLELDPTNAEAKSLLGLILLQRGSHEDAIVEFEGALHLSPNSRLQPEFGIVTARLLMRQASNAVAALERALSIPNEAYAREPQVLGRWFHRICIALFENSDIAACGQFLIPALDLIEREGYLIEFERSLAGTVFKLLKQHESTSREQLADILTVFETILAKRFDLGLAVKLLRVGIEYFKRDNQRDLLSLTKEERHLFCTQLGIPDPGE